MNLNLRNPLAFFDIEATGLDIISDRIVEIAIVKVMPNAPRQILHKKINPERSIPKEASLIHGIYDEDIKDAPTFRQVAKEISNFIKGCDLAGYNLMKFDIPILAESFLRENMDFCIDNKYIVDVQKIFHTMEKRTLSAAYKFYCGKDLENAHTALADTEATIDVLCSQVDKYLNHDIVSMSGKKVGQVKNDIDSLASFTEKNVVDYAGKFVFDSNKDPIFNFGKYKGKKVSEVLLSDPRYYDWMMDGHFTMDTKKKLTRIKLGEFDRNL